MINKIKDHKLFSLLSGELGEFRRFVIPRISTRL